LFGSLAVQDIARRRSSQRYLPDLSRKHRATNRGRFDLRGGRERGHDAVADTVPQRQRALIDIAEKGVRNLGKGIPARDLKDATIAHVATLKTIKLSATSAKEHFLLSLTTSFFEWAFFRLLIELGDGWTDALIAACEPPLLGRVVALWHKKRWRTQALERRLPLA